MKGQPQVLQVSTLSSTNLPQTALTEPTTIFISGLVLPLAGSGFEDSTARTKVISNAKSLHCVKCRRNFSSADELVTSVNNCRGQICHSCFAKREAWTDEDSQEASDDEDPTEAGDLGTPVKQILKQISFDLPQKRLTGTIQEFACAMPGCSWVCDSEQALSKHIRLTHTGSV